MNCVNDTCDNNPDHSIDMMIVSIDGDMACNKKCKAAHDKQRDHFYNDIVSDDIKFRKWMLGL